MNRLFNLKACIILFALVICQAELRAQSVSKEDTTKKKGSSMVVKSDTALIVKAGATIVQKADTTMVINADPELIRKFNEIVAAKQKDDQVKQNKADSASSKQNTFTQTRTNPPANQPDNSASAPASSTVPVSAVNPGGAATSAVTGAAKTDASIPSQTNTTNNTQPANNSSATNQVASTTPANKPDSTSSASNTSQQTAANTNSTQQSKPDSTSTSNNNAGVQSQKADSTKQVASGNTAAKTDSALTASNDTTKAKKDTTLKSDTSKMKKDTSLMVTDTASHVIKAKAVYLEVGGAGLAISANYDSRFHDERNGWGYRVGAGFFSSGGNTVFTVPFQINYLTGEHSMHIELGAGTTFLNSTGTNIGTSKWEFDKVTGFIATATIGFRYQPEHKGLNFRLAFTPILYDEGLMPVGGVSIGYTFR